MTDRLRGVLQLMCAATLACVGMAAGAGERPLKFEVISIRRHTAQSGPVQRPTTTPNGFRSIGLNLFAIFQTAYVPPNQSGVLRADLIAGAPDWLRDEAYDIVAKVGEADLADWQKPEMTQTMLHAMLQALLAERFKVVVHHESREMPVYNLVVAKGGPKFKAAEPVDAGELRRKLDGGGMVGTLVRVEPGANGTKYYGISMAILTQSILPGMAGRPVVDKTGLSGSYDLTVPDLKRLSTAASDSAAGPEESIFSVLPDVLGLRLESAKGQIDTLVVDQVERPTEN